MIKKIKLLGLSLAFLSQFSFGGVVYSTLQNGACDTSKATLTSIKLTNLDIDADNNTATSNTSSGGPVGNNLLNLQHTSSECIGIYSGNDTNLTDNNIGELDDNFLNGDSSVLTGYEFIDGMVDGVVNPWFDGDPINVDGVGLANDPGWINLARYDVDSDNVSYNSMSNLGGTSLAIDDILNLSFSCTMSGNDCSSISWTLTTDKDIVTTVQNFLGRSSFDHLAFVAKAGSGYKAGDEDKGNQDNRGWAIYDFNFYEIFGKELLAGNTNFNTAEKTFGTAYSLSGTIDVKPGDFSAGLSHLSVYARDPIPESTQVPEPSTIAIFGLSLIGLSLRRKKA
jgi:hypothetical protein